MSRLPAVSGPELVKALQRAGFRMLCQKDGRVSMEKTDALAHWQTVVPMHRENARGTLFQLSKCDKEE